MILESHTSDLSVSARRNVEYPSEPWRFDVEGRRSYAGERHIARITFTRTEALRLRAELNRLLKATAPPRRR